MLIYIPYISLQGKFLNDIWTFQLSFDIGTTAKMGQAASRQEAFWEACGFGHKERVRRYLEMDGIDVNWVSYTVRLYSSKYKK